VTIAYDGPARDEADLRRIAEERQKAFDLRYDLTKMLAQRRRLSSDVATISPDAKLLMDDFAPVESLKAIEAHNRKWPEP